MVSDADREAEHAIEDLLLAERPRDGLLAEEGARAESNTGRLWVVDPLDGTTNYLYGFPAWAVSIALEDENGGLVGVVFDPLRSELFTVIRGEGARLNGKPIQVNAISSLDTALIATGFGYQAQRRSEQAEVLLRVLPRVRDIRRAGAAALDMCWVGAGRVDGYFERGVNHWDRAAGALVAAEAGAEIIELGAAPAGLVVAEPAVARELFELVRTAGD